MESSVNRSAGIRAGLSGVLVPFGAFSFCSQTLHMDDTQYSIGLTALLDEVDRDLDELRKKNPTDYSIRNIAMWWSLERERLTTRHGPAALVKRIHRMQGVRRMAVGFFVGWATMLAVNTAIRLLIP